MSDEYTTQCPVEVEPIDGLDAYTVRITGQLLDQLGEESIFHLSRVIAIAVYETKAERAAASAETATEGPTATGLTGADFGDSGVGEAGGVSDGPQ